MPSPSGGFLHPGVPARKSGLRPANSKRMPISEQSFAPGGRSDAARLTVWTIYRHPSDYPGRWVMRGHEIFLSVGMVRSHDACFVVGSLDEIRAYVPAGDLSCRPRAGRLSSHLEDYPVLYGCWLSKADG